jgi:hypothetical protein
MISSEVLKQYLDFAQDAYHEHNDSGQAYRQEGRVPYAEHPLGSALLCLADTKLSYEDRERGFKILVLHDVLEDTSLLLPEWVEEDVCQGVEAMTYRGEETLPAKREWIMGHESFIKLLTLYDMFWNLYERHIGGSEERRALWKRTVFDLTDAVEREYGNLRIVQVSRTVAEETEW